MGYLITVSEKSVKDDDSVSFKKSPMMPIFTNSSGTKFTVTGLKPFTVYAFQIQVTILPSSPSPSLSSLPSPSPPPSSSTYIIINYHHVFISIKLILIQIKRRL